MRKLIKVTRSDINRENMVALSYCQCQTILDAFAYDYKIGYNAGVYGWNYDLYRINGTDVVTGYNVPHASYSDKVKKERLINLENKVRNISFSDVEKHRKELEKEFFEIFE